MDNPKKLKKKSPSTEQTLNALKNAGISYNSDIKNAINAAVNKAKKVKTVKTTSDSTDFYKKEIEGYNNLIKSEPKTAMGKSNTNVYLDFKSKANDNLNRQYLKGKPGYDKNGFPIKKRN